jgi:hypothetical protein
MVFTKSFMIKIKDGIVGIFDPKGKKKAKKDPELQSQQSTVTVKQEGRAITKKPTGGGLPKVLLTKEEEAFKQNPAAAIALLHYELNEAALGVSNAKSMKSIKGVTSVLPILHGYALFCFGPKNSFRLACHQISCHKHFGNFIILLIGISTVCLALQTPLDDPLGE